MIRLLALDLDGTLMEPGERILPELVEALAALPRRGVEVATASGRPLEDQLRMLSRNGLGAAAGAPRFIIANEQEIYELRGGGYEPWEEFNRSVRSAWLAALPRALRLAEEVAREHPGAAVWGPEVAARRGMVVVSFGSAEEARRAEERLRALLAGDPELQCDRNYRLVQILHRRAGKGQTLLALASALGLPPSSVLCVGDATNDLSMLDGRFGFLAAAVGNAEAEVAEAVRRRGGYVASRPRGEGVLEILRAFGLA